jgi:asparaginyl-tRNA synthetase
MTTKVKEIYEQTEKYMSTQVTVCGWVRTLRDSKNFGFIELNDGTFFKSIQVVFHNDLDNFNEIVKLGSGSSVIVSGEVIKSLGDKQIFELKASSISIEGLSQEDYPLQKKRHTLEYLRTIAHLRPRTNIHMAVFRVRSLASFAVHEFFVKKGFVMVHTPIITTSDCEGAGEMFKVTSFDLENISKDKDGKVNFKEDFFGKMAGLTVSGQLSAETFAHAFRDVYTFGPTFRAENSNTTRHAAEFWMIEPEMAFADLTKIMDVEEEMLKYIINYVLENAKEEMEFLNSFVDKDLISRLNNVVSSSFERVTYTEAIEILQKSDVKFEFPVNWGVDLQTEHERYLTEIVYKKPIFLTDYPKEIKSFYMRVNDDNKTVAATDLLVPGIGELIGGSQREERLHVLEARMDELGLIKEDYWWYLDLRKYGTTKHAGYGMGFERCVMYLTGVNNIRDVIPFPRTVKNSEF